MLLGKSLISVQFCVWWGREVWPGSSSGHTLECQDGGRVQVGGWVQAGLGGYAAEASECAKYVGEELESQWREQEEVVWQEEQKGSGGAAGKDMWGNTNK